MMDQPGKKKLNEIISRSVTGIHNEYHQKNKGYVVRSMQKF